jgi:hypothetical protein
MICFRTTTVSTTFSKAELCGWMVMMSPVNWHGLVFGGGTPNASTKNRSAGLSACVCLNSGNK